MAPKALPSRSAAHSGAALLAAVKPKPPELLTVTVNQPLCLQQQTSVEPLPEIPDLLTDLSLSLALPLSRLGCSMLAAEQIYRSFTAFRRLCRFGVI